MRADQLSRQQRETLLAANDPDGCVARKRGGVEASRVFRGGHFVNRAMARSLRDHGLLTVEWDRVELTEQGRQIVAEMTEGEPS